jgi:2-desacetyl-2-hydroxyethyl bacteriochlorophyllide A dehydrogenase
MKALVFHGECDLRYEEVPFPEMKDDEALIRVKAVGICGSDVHGYLGNTGRRTPPMIMGHEFSGIVEKVGSAVKNLKIGEKVVVFPSAGCGHCSYCQKGAVNQCPDKKVLGSFTTNGAMAEYISVRGDLLFPLPIENEYAHGALAEPLSVALRAVNKADLHPETTVTIVGSGVIGLMCLILAKRQKPKSIAVVDIVNRRLDLALELGADFVFNPKRREPSGFINDPFNGGTDVVIEAVGVTKTVRQSIQWAARGGKIVIVGLSQKLMELDMHEIVNKEVRIEGSFLYNRQDFQTILKELSALKPSLDKLISLTAPLREGVDLFKRLAEMDEKLLKVILTD